jgi:hypothetical protein
MLMALGNAEDSVALGECGTNVFFQICPVGNLAPEAHNVQSFPSSFLEAKTLKNKIGALF